MMMHFKAKASQLALVTRRGGCARGTGCVMLCAILLSGLVTHVQAQRPMRHEAVISKGPELEQSPVVTNLFRTAEQAIDREDWKLAIDSLQRVIEAPAGLLKATTSRALDRYESPRLKAYRMLADLPDAGREAYGVLYDGRAKGLLERARLEHDLTSAKQAFDVYLLSRHGREAAKLLSSWLLDAGRAAEVLHVLQMYWSVFPDAGREEPWLIQRQAVAYAMLGDDAMANEMLGMVEGGNAALMTGVRGFVSHYDTTRPPLGDVEWTGPAGGGSGRRSMVAAVPTMADELPWRRTMPQAPVVRWTELDQFGHDALPVAEPVVYDDRLFVKSGSEVQAIDLLSFGVMWSAGGGTLGIAERFAVGPGFTDQDQLFSDYVEGSLSAGAGLVFSVESGQEIDSGADGVTIRSANRQPVRVVGRRLVAYDARTGERRWRRGGTDDPVELMSEALIMSPPLVVDGDIWLPFESRNAIYFGVLDPADGTLVDQILLFALGGRTMQREKAMMAATDSGMIYLSTGFGLLLAIDGTSRELRWATRYRENEGPRSGRRRFNRQIQKEPLRWFPQPPMVAGSLVILAPTDDDRVIAFDRIDGTLVWDWPRDQHKYLIGTDDEYVWLGGQTITCVSLSQQSMVWSQSVERVTGRAALSGGRIYQPTETTVVSFDATTGEPGRSTAIPAGHPPLGNIVFVQGAMISVDPSEARSYPDLTSYEVTLAAHEAQPEDARTAIRLAFLELLRERPRNALDVLSGVRLPPEDMMAAHVDHLRVDAMLKLATQPGTSVEDSVQYLREASKMASSDRDRVQTQLALGDTLRRMGRYREAYETLWRMGMDPLADEFVQQGEVKRSARAAAADVLLRIEPELGPDEVDILGRAAREMYENATSMLERFETRTEATRTLRRLADVRTLGGWGQAALNGLARFEIDRGRFERAEQYLNEAMRFGRSREKLAESLVLKSDLYLKQSPDMALSARRALDELEVDYPGLSVGGVGVGELVAERRRQLDEPAADWHERVEDIRGFEMAGRDAFEPFDDASQPLVMVDFRMADPEAVYDRLVAFAGPRMLRSYDTREGKMTWEAELLMTHDFAYGLEDVGSSATEPDVVTGWSDGQTMVVNGPKGLYAIGVISGLRLWAVPLDGRPYLREYRTDAADGRLACMIAPTELAVLSMLDGSVLWRRDLGSEPGGVYVRDGYVMVIDAETEHIRAFRLSNGAGLGEITFDQPDSLQEGGEFIAMTYHDGVVCGPVDRGLAAYRVSTGLEEWSRSFDNQPASAFEPTPGKVLVASRSGAYELLDVVTGHVDAEGQMVEEAGLIVDGGVFENQLILATHTEAVNGDRWTLAAMDMGTGSVAWTYEFPGLLHRPSLRSEGDLLVLMEYLPTDFRAAPDKSRLYMDEQAIVLLDKRTGSRVGSPSPWSGYINSNPLRGHIALKSGRIVVQASRGVGALVTRATSGDSGGVD